MRIAKQGYPLIITGAAITSVAAAIGWKFASSFFGLATLAVAGFFRDPERQIPAGEGLVAGDKPGHRRQRTGQAVVMALDEATVVEERPAPRLARLEQGAEAGSGGRRRNRVG